MSDASEMLRVDGRRKFPGMLVHVGAGWRRLLSNLNELEYVPGENQPKVLPGIPIGLRASRNRVSLGLATAVDYQLQSEAVLNGICIRSADRLFVTGKMLAENCSKFFQADALPKPSGSVDTRPSRAGRTDCGRRPRSHACSGSRPRLCLAGTWPSASAATALVRDMACCKAGHRTCDQMTSASDCGKFSRQQTAPRSGSPNSQTLPFRLGFPRRFPRFSRSS